MIVWMKMMSGLAIGLLPLGGALAQTAPLFATACPSVPGGFYTVPGTDTCLRIGGSLAAEFNTRLSPLGSVPVGLPRQSATLLAPGLATSRINLRLSVDVRAQTELGPVRAFVSLRRPRGALP